jgi:hypothetical protein
MVVVVVVEAPELGDVVDEPTTEVEVELVVEVEVELEPAGPLNAKLLPVTTTTSAPSLVGSGDPTSTVLEGALSEPVDELSIRPGS